MLRQRQFRNLWIERSYPQADRTGVFIIDAIRRDPASDGRS